MQIKEVEGKTRSALPAGNTASGSKLLQDGEIEVVFGNL